MSSQISSVAQSSSHVPSTGASAGASVGSSASLGNSVCAFWIGDTCYALDTDLVGEVVNVEDIVVVPLAPAGVLGLFNLRGTPVALVDLSTVLQLPHARQRSETRTALVLRKTTVLGALIIDRMEAVVPVGQGNFSPRERTDGQVAVQGFLELKHKDLVLTVLDKAALLAGLQRLKYR